QGSDAGHRGVGAENANDLDGALDDAFAALLLPAGSEDIEGQLRPDTGGRADVDGNQPGLVIDQGDLPHRLVPQCLARERRPGTGRADRCGRERSIRTVRRGLSWFFSVLRLEG